MVVQHRVGGRSARPVRTGEQRRPRLRASVALIAVLSLLQPSLGRPQDASIDTTAFAAAIERLYEHRDDVEAANSIASKVADLDLDWNQRGEWPDQQVDLYCWAVAVLTEPEIDSEYLPRGKAASRVRAADLALERKRSEIGGELEWAIAYELLNANRPEEAIERLEPAIEVYRSDPECAAQLFTLLGHAQRWAGDLGAAYESSERAFEQQRRASEAGVEVSVDVLVYLLNLRFQLELALGLPDHAALTRRREVDLSPAIASPHVLDTFLLDQGDLDLATERWELLIERVQERLDQDGADGPSELVRAALQFQLGSALSVLGHHDPSALERSSVAFDEVVDNSQATPRLRLSALIRRADVERQLGRIDSARQTLDAAREQAREFGTTTDTLAAGSMALLTVVDARIQRAEHPTLSAESLERLGRDLEQGYGSFLHTWSSVPKRRDGVGLFLYGEQGAVLCELIGNLVERFGAERGGADALELLMKSQSLGSIVQHLGGPAPTLDEARRTLCSDQRGVLVVVPGEDRSFLLAFDRTRTVAIEAQPWWEWEEDQVSWSTAVAESPRRAQRPEQRRRQVQDLGAKVARELLPDRLQAFVAPWSDISIAAWDSIGYLPFEALPFRTGMFGDHFAITYLPSIAVGCSLARRCANTHLPRVQEARMIGAPLSPNEPIPWHEDRADELRELLGAENVVTRIGEHATLDALQEICDGRARVLEILAHGSYDFERVPPAYFALTASKDHDGRVYCDDVQLLRATPLVAMAVCGAGRGPLRSGDDGVANLGGAFLQAGAAAVVLASVDLEQAPTERLFDAMYADLWSRGTGPAEALLHARQELARDPKTADPFDRCLVHVVGLGFQPVFNGVEPSASTSGNWWLWVAVIAAIALIALTRMRRVFRA